jgi:folate-binding protein YgfZ
MKALEHHEFHAGLNATFGELDGLEIVFQYDAPELEFARLTASVGVIDLSPRGRVCLLGEDRVKFLHGQVTNDVNRLQSGQGCYSAITDNKGRIQSDLNIHLLENEILLDFEPGLTAMLTERLERFIVADDVEVCDVAEAFGLISIQGPNSEPALNRLDLGVAPPDLHHAVTAVEHDTLGQLYLVNLPRLNSRGFDLYAPMNAVPAIFDKLISAAKDEDGGPVGWNAFDAARIAAGIPRFGQDMTPANLAPEAGIEDRAISYSKGCYIGQEILNRLHNFAQVNKSLQRLAISGDRRPETGDAIFVGEKKAGSLTSVTTLPTTGERLALGYVRKEFANAETGFNGKGFTAKIIQPT